MNSPTIVVLIDGFDPEYLDACAAPNIAAMSTRGFRVEGRGMTPSVTNVNNVSLVTGSFPESHGITSNYLLDRELGEEFYMESGEFLRAQTMFQRATEAGMRSLLVTAKDKLRRLLAGTGPDDGATVSISSEEPPGWVVDAVGEPPHIYSLEVNRWVLDAGRYAMSREPFDLVYLTTTDYAMHTYGPHHPESAPPRLAARPGAGSDSRPGARGADAGHRRPRHVRQIPDAPPSGRAGTLRHQGTRRSGHQGPLRRAPLQSRRQHICAPGRLRRPERGPRHPPQSAGRRGSSAPARRRPGGSA